MFDVLIKNGTVIDGTGKKAFRADVGIKDDVIFEVGELAKEDAKTIIDATGKFVTPGFIDVGNHSDTYWTLFSDPLQESLLYQGITTVIGGNCGSSLAPLITNESIRSIQKWASVDRVNVDWNTMEEFLDRMATKKIGVNFGTLIGHSTLRRAFMEDESRALTAEETKKFLQVTDQSMQSGAFGLSSGLVYTHGQPGSAEEIYGIAEKIRSFSGVYTTHLRNEMGLFRDAVTEALHVAQTTDVRVHISHLKVLGQFYWHLFPEALAEISEKVRTRSDVTFDIFPYTATGSVLYTILPEWASRGGKMMMLGRLRDLNTRREIIEELRRKQLDYSKIRISLAKNGSRKTIEEMADEQGIDPEATILDLLLANEGRVIVFFDLISEENIVRALKSPHSMIATDGVGYSMEHKKTEDRIHPRSFGAFPRVLGKYVREEKVLTWEEAVFKMTGFPAQKFEIKKRGNLKEGYFADVVVFDPETITDEATFENPYRYATGIGEVILNGQSVIHNGKCGKEGFGKILRK